MYEIKSTNQFDKHAIRCINRKYDISLLENVISLLELNGKLPAKYTTHPLCRLFGMSYQARLVVNLETRR